MKKNICFDVLMEGYLYNMEWGNREGNGEWGREWGMGNKFGE